MNIVLEVKVIRKGKVSGTYKFDGDAGKSKGKTFQYIGTKDNADFPDWGKIPIKLKAASKAKTSKAGKATK